MPETPRVYPGVSSTNGIEFSLELQGCATTPNAEASGLGYPKGCLEARRNQYGSDLGSKPRDRNPGIETPEESPNQKVRHPGVEPGPPRWQREIITARLMTL